MYSMYTACLELLELLHITERSRRWIPESCERGVGDGHDDRLVGKPLDRLFWRLDPGKSIVAWLQLHIG